MIKSLVLSHNAANSFLSTSVWQKAQEGQSHPGQMGLRKFAGIQGKGGTALKRQRVFVLLFSVIAIIYASDAPAFNIYQVGKEVMGQEHNEFLKRWIDRKFSIWVGIDEKKTEYILFKADTGLSDATVMVKNTKATRDNLEQTVAKAIKWAEVARENQADASKPLGCFGNDFDGICAKYGHAYDENQIGLSFYAANDGLQTNLILSIIDRDNQFIKVNIYLDLSEMKQLLGNIQAIESVLKKARETSSKQNLFK